MDQSESFTRLWTRVQPIVAGFITSAIPDFREAEDVLQNVAVVLLRKFSEYDSRRPFLPWSLAIARREVLSSKRKKARSILSYQSDLIEQISEVYEELAPELEARSRALQECIRQLDGRASEIIHLRYEEDLKPRQIAVRLGIRPLNVRVMLSRIRSLLRACIERKVNADVSTS